MCVCVCVRLLSVNVDRIIMLIVAQSTKCDIWQCHKCSCYCCYITQG